MIATDTILVGSVLKHAGDEFEVAAGAPFEKSQKRGHLPAGSKEAEAFLAQLGKRKKAKKSAKVKPAKGAFNEDDEDEESEEEKDKKVLSKMNLSELQYVAKEKSVATKDEKGKAFTRKELIEAIKALDSEESSDLA